MRVIRQSLWRTLTPPLAGIAFMALASCGYAPDPTPLTLAGAPAQTRETLAFQTERRGFEVPPVSHTDASGEAPANPVAITKHTLGPYRSAPGEAYTGDPEPECLTPQSRCANPERDTRPDLDIGLDPDPYPRARIPEIHVYAWPDYEYPDFRLVNGLLPVIDGRTGEETHIDPETKILGFKCAPMRRDSPDQHVFKICLGVDPSKLTPEGTRIGRKWVCSSTRGCWASWEEPDEPGGSEEPDEPEGSEGPEGPEGPVAQGRLYVAGLHETARSVFGNPARGMQAVATLGNLRLMVNNAHRIAGDRVGLGIEHLWAGAGIALLAGYERIGADSDAVPIYGTGDYRTGGVDVWRLGLRHGGLVTGTQTRWSAGIACRREVMDAQALSLAQGYEADLCGVHAGMQARIGARSYLGVTAAADTGRDGDLTLNGTRTPLDETSSWHTRAQISTRW